MKRRESEVSRRRETREDCENPKKIQASHAIAESTRKNSENHRSRLSKACKQEAKWQNWVERNGFNAMECVVSQSSKLHAISTSICLVGVGNLPSSDHLGGTNSLTKQERPPNPCRISNKTDGQRFCPHSWEQHYCQRRPAWQPILVPACLKINFDDLKRPTGKLQQKGPVITASVLSSAYEAPSSLPSNGNNKTSSMFFRADSPGFPSSWTRHNLYSIYMCIYIYIL